MQTEPAPAWRIRYADGSVGPDCKSRECAIASIHWAEGRLVAAEECGGGNEAVVVTLPVDPPVSGLRFRLAYTTPERGVGVGS